MQTLTVQIKPYEALKEVSSYDAEIEKFVATQKDRIIEVTPVTIDGKTYYECAELPYWKFTDSMLMVLKDALSIEELIANYEDIKLVSNSSAEAEKLKKAFFKNFKNEYLIVEKSA